MAWATVPGTKGIEFTVGCCVMNNAVLDPWQLIIIVVLKVHGRNQHDIETITYKVIDMTSLFLFLPIRFDESVNKFDNLFQFQSLRGLVCFEMFLDLTQ